MKELLYDHIIARLHFSGSYPESMIPIETNQIMRSVSTIPKYSNLSLTQKLNLTDQAINISIETWRKTQDNIEERRAIKKRFTFTTEYK